MCQERRRLQGGPTDRNEFRHGTARAGDDEMFATLNPIHDVAPAVPQVSDGHFRHRGTVSRVRRNHGSCNAVEK